MTAGIIDSTVIIHIFRRNPAARVWMNALKTRLAVTTITWLEVLYTHNLKHMRVLLGDTLPQKPY